MSTRPHEWDYAPSSGEKKGSVKSPWSKEEPIVRRRRGLHSSSPSERCTVWMLIYSNLHDNPEEESVQMTEGPRHLFKIINVIHLDLNPSLCSRCPSLLTTLGNSQGFASWWPGCLLVPNIQTALGVQMNAMSSTRRWEQKTDVLGYLDKVWPGRPWCWDQEFQQ